MIRTRLIPVPSAFALLLILLLETFSPSGVARGALTQAFENPTTVALRARTQLFEPHLSGGSGTEELSTASVVLAESEAMTSPAAVLPRVRSEQPQDATLSGSNVTLAGSRLPVRADRSTTAAQLLQLLRFERRNQIAEAYLLARDLVARDPSDELAIDAAIRTSLVLGRDSDVESLYRQAIQRAKLPGKYYVQLAHWYLRSGHGEKLKALIGEFEKTPLRDGEYYLTLARMRVIAESPQELETALSQALKQKAEALFPMLLLSARAYRSLNVAERAKELLLQASADDFGPWERRTQLLEYLKLPGITPEGVVAMIESAMVNEPSYPRARALADRILDRALEERIFFALKHQLMEKLLHDDVSDIERWLVALMYEREGEPTAMLQVLQGTIPDDVLTSHAISGTTTTAAMHDEDEFMGGTTPVIAYERAMTLGKVGRHQEAIALASNLLAEQPTEWQVRLLLAQEQLSAGESTAALQTLSAGLVRDDLNAEVRARRAELATSAALKLDDAELLVNVWSELARNGTVEELEKMRGTVLRAADPGTTPSEIPLRERVDQIIAARSRGEKERSLWLLRGALAARDGDRRQEVQDYLRFVEHEPENIAILHLAAQLAMRYAAVSLELSRKGQAATLRASDVSGTDLALRLYRRLIELQPRVASNYSALLRLYLMRGEAETAKRVATELAERQTSTPEALATAARILHENGFAADALAFYRLATPQAPEDFELWANYAGALRAAGKLEAAQNILRRILEEGLYNRPFAQEAILKALFEMAQSASTLPALVDYLDGLRGRDLPDKREFLLICVGLLSASDGKDRLEPFLTDFLRQFPDDPHAAKLVELKSRMQAARGEGGELTSATSPAETSGPAALLAKVVAAETHAASAGSPDAVEALVKIATENPTSDRAQAALLSAACIAEEKVQDPVRALGLYQQYLNSGAQDFEARKKARVAVRRLTKTAAASSK